MVNTRSSYSVAVKKIMKGESISENYYNSKVLKRYFKYLTSLEYADSSITHKLMYIIKLDEYLSSKNTNFKEMTDKDLYDYFEICDKKGNWGNSSKQSSKEHIKSFLNWAINLKLVKYSGDCILPKIVYKNREKLRTYYTIEEITKMFNAIDRTTIRGKEDFLILLLICFYGIRISDVCNLKLSNIDFNKKVISISMQKTNKVLYLPLIDEVEYALYDYLKNTRTSKNINIDNIFITQEYPYSTNKNIMTENIVKKYLEKGGVNINKRKHGFHSLRHSFSVNLLNNNTPIHVISSILGHDDMNATMVYLNTDISKLSELALEVPYVK